MCETLHILDTRTFSPCIILRAVWRMYSVSSHSVPVLWHYDAIYMPHCSAQGIMGLCQSQLSLSLSLLCFLIYKKKNSLPDRPCECHNFFKRRCFINLETMPHQSVFLASDVTYVSGCLLTGLKSLHWLWQQAETQRRAGYHSPGSSKLSCGPFFSQQRIQRICKCVYLNSLKPKCIAFYENTQRWAINP